MFIEGMVVNRVWLLTKSMVYGKGGAAPRQSTSNPLASDLEATNGHEMRGGGTERTGDER
uniref:Uncharacterized protein n=1 Tax=viral metagenome TaxID=1070528 RepID=A0A6M3XPC3_9ZZZZ